MTQQQFNDAARLQSQIDTKKKQLRAFENGKITSLHVRLFNESKTEFEDKVFDIGLPAARLKGVMLDVLKTELSTLEIKLNSMFTVEPQPVSINGL